MIAAAYGFQSAGPYRAVGAIGTFDAADLPLMGLTAARWSCEDSLMYLTDTHMCVSANERTGTIDHITACTPDTTWRYFKKPDPDDPAYIGTFEGVAIPRPAMIGWFIPPLRPVMLWGRFGVYKVVVIEHGVRRTLLERRLANVTEFPWIPDVIRVDPCGRLLLCVIEDSRASTLWVFRKGQ